MSRARPAGRWLLLLLAIGGCAAPGAITTGEVTDMLGAQAEAWNRGDMAGFLAAYRDDEQLTFFGSNGLRRGFEAISRGFAAGYPDAAARGRLQFELLEVRPLGPEHALVLGRFALERTQPQSGFFSLVVQRLPSGLRIVHDHTSADS